MASLLDRPRARRPPPAVRAQQGRPVVLATLSVRVDAEAERMALESALEAGVPLIVANMIAMPSYPTTMVLAREYATLPHEEDLEEVRATAGRAAASGSRPSCCGSRAAARCRRCSSC